jgi:hypothetical protein
MDHNNLGPFLVTQHTVRVCRLNSVTPCIKKVLHNFDNYFYLFLFFISKSKKFLFKRISLAIQRGNAASIRGTFPDSALLSEICALYVNKKCYVIMLSIYSFIIFFICYYINTNVSLINPKSV